MTTRKKKGKPAVSADEEPDTSPRKSSPLAKSKGRPSELAVSRGGMNQESRQHNKPGPDQRS